mgnify:CR=1 FL=1
MKRWLLSTVRDFLRRAQRPQDRGDREDRADDEGGALVEPADPDEEEDEAAAVAFHLWIEPPDASFEERAALAASDLQAGWGYRVDAKPMPTARGVPSASSTVNVPSTRVGNRGTVARSSKAPRPSPAAAPPRSQRPSRRRRCAGRRPCGACVT